jgi:hypothetical protein
MTPRQSLPLAERRYRRASRLTLTSTSSPRLGHRPSGQILPWLNRKNAHWDAAGWSEFIASATAFQAPSARFG